MVLIAINIKKLFCVINDKNKTVLLLYHYYL